MNTSTDHIDAAKFFTALLHPPFADKPTISDYRVIVHECIEDVILNPSPLNMYWAEYYNMSMKYEEMRRNRRVNLCKTTDQS